MPKKEDEPEEFDLEIVEDDKPEEIELEVVEEEEEVMEVLPAEPRTRRIVHPIHPFREATRSVKFFGRR